MKKRSSVTITVGIPAFNRLDLLKRTLESVYAQEELPDEILVIDNCSTDGTREYLKTLKNVKVFFNKTNIGPIENYNETIRCATSDYIVSLASDDILLPDFIKRWKEIISKNKKDIVAFTSAGYIIDAKDKIKGIIRYLPKDVILKPPQTIKIFLDHYQPTLELSCWTVYKKEVFNKTGLFTDKYGRIPDMEMAMKILPHFPIYYCSKPLCAFRHHNLQGIIKKVNDAEKFEFENAVNASKILYDYENDPFIKTSFSERERKNRIFIRKFLLFSLIASIFYFIMFDVKKGLKYLKVYKKFYPKPYFSFLTIRLFIGWILFLIKLHLQNYIVCFKFKNKSITEIYKYEKKR